MSWERFETRLLLDGVPLLHSNALADTKIYLDFDGHTTTGTSWNSRFSSIHSPPFDIDGQTKIFSAKEQTTIVSIWERMAEDFRPFDVDVTTEDPSVDSPRIFVDGGKALRVVFTSKFDAGEAGSSLRWFESDAPGAAVESWNLGLDTPVFVFSTHPLAGEIGSHEVGHAIGLTHDSALDKTGNIVEYRGEHGSGATRWSPIMGQGNGLSQWSKGEYPDATNLEPDVGILLQTFGQRPDDYLGISPLIEDGDCAGVQHVDVGGIIGHASDTDIFVFEVCDQSAKVALEILPWHNGPNLDIGVSLLNGSGFGLIRSTDEAFNPVDNLHSTVNLELEPGTYYLQVEGVGKEPRPGDPGYSDYGSLGYYEIMGSIRSSAVAPDTLSVDFDGNGWIDELDLEILRRSYGSEQELSWADGDLTGDAKVDFEDFLWFAANYDERK